MHKYMTLDNSPIPLASLHINTGSQIYQYYIKYIFKDSFQSTAAFDSQNENLVHSTLP